MMRTAARLLLAPVLLFTLYSAPASADPAPQLGIAPVFPTTARVGQPGLTAQLVITNSSSGAGPVTITEITLNPACGSVNLGCPTPDPGTVTLSSLGTGQAGTACAGVTFTVSAPDANGRSTFTPSNPVVLQPPGSGDSCTINFTFRVVHMPTIDAQPASPGIQTVAVATVAGTVTVGSTTFFPTARGLQTYNVFPPHSRGDFDGGGTTDVAVFRPSLGQWYFQGRPTVYWGANGDVSVAADYTGDGIADVAVFRPSNNAWYIQGRATTFWGASGDIPVPADYTGDGMADVAVFRPSTGAWFIQGKADTYWGASGDIPVPADYNGDGITDIAVFRPSTGAWFIQGVANTFWGASGDIPVPADYDNNGTADVAVFRPSTGAWFIQGEPNVFWGASGDVPVPGDYDGNGTVEIAVFRPSNGAWYIQGQPTTFWGGSGDVPV